jgi:predicted CopG family antitoxin
MKSPFAVFRKHQKVLMVVLVGLAMFAFTIEGVLTGNNAAGVPLLCGVAGMAIFGYIGWRRGEPVTFGAVGIAIGVVVGVFLMLHSSGTGPKAPIETDAGNLSHAELQNLITRRNVANNFVSAAIVKAENIPSMENNSFYQQMLQQQIQRQQFGFGHDRDNMTEDVLLGFLLDKEADEMGISVSEDAVSDYINRITNKKLTTKDFASIVKQQRVSESEVFDAIRGELKARLAMEMMMPRAVPSPEQFWDDYRKLQMTETLDVAAVPIADFVSAAPNPTEDQLLNYFDQWKQMPPAYPGGPGLLQPRRLRVEYLQADFAETEKEVAAKTPLTDQEIKKYYDDHHEEYRNRPAAGSTKQPFGNPAGPTLPLPSIDKTPAGSKPGTPAPQKTVLPGKTPAPAQKAPAATPKNDSKNNGKSSALDIHRQLAPNQPEGEMLALADWKAESTQLALADAPKEPAAPPLPRPPAAKATGSPGAKTPAAKVPGKTESVFPPLGGDADKSEPEFRPLDEILKGEIRSQILRTRTMVAMHEKMDKAADYMRTLREQLLPAEIGATPKMSAEQREQTLKDYAAQNHLKYVLTPPLSAQELHDDAEKYPIATATEPVDDQFQQRAPTQAIAMLFGSLPEVVFEPYRAEDGDSHTFAYWKVEDIADHIPTLKEPGVREQAIRDYKIGEFAQKKAQERAGELADLVRKSKKSMTETLAGQKITKSEKGPAVVVVPTPPFSWYTVQSAAPRDMTPDSVPRLSEITGISDPDDTFMKAVFDEMKVGEVRVVPNHGPTVFYVVKLKTRHPSDDAEREAFRARFMKERLFGSGLMYGYGGRTPYDYLNMPEQQQLASTWMDRLYAKYRVRRNIEEETRRQRRPTG